MHSSQGGSILLSCIFMMVLMAALMAAMVTLTGHSSRAVAYETLALRARLTAESALERAVFEQLAAPVGTTIAPLEFDHGGCTAVAEAVLQSPVNGEEIHYIKASGRCAGGDLRVQRTLEVEVIK